jgi:lysophospholipase L1-like esterase
MIAKEKLTAIVLYIVVVLISPTRLEADELIKCDHFTAKPLAPPAGRDDQRSLNRFATINAALETGSNEVIFFGDSLTERWSPDIWRRNFLPLRALNAGIDGDRTEHLLWRIDHTDLVSAPPRIIVLLIGTNDLGYGRPPEIAAEGVRADLRRLRELLPNAHILLLGLLPRSDRFGREIDAVNRLVATCNGGLVTYENVGNALRDNGKLSTEVFQDGVHLTEIGYARVTRYLKIAITSLLVQ